MNKIKLIEVARSYSRKIKGYQQYEMIDVFASRKAECAPEEAEEVSKFLYAECVKEVEADIIRLRTKPETYIDPDTLEVREGSYAPSPNKNSKFKGGRPWCKTCGGRIGDHDCDNCTYCSGDGEREDIELTAKVGEIE